MQRIGVDIGGTFTDAVAIDDRGRIRTAKALTTPGHLHDGVLAAVEALGIDWDDVTTFIHGTTAGLNAFLERRGAKVALLTTRGFRDVYELGRANRPEMYNVRYRPPRPLVPRRSVFEVDERLAADGSVLTPIDEDAVRTLLDRLVVEGYEAVAVCLLHAYANPEHERIVAGLVHDAAPSLSVVCSHDVAPEWREYERTSTTVLSAYVAPIVERYLADLEERLADRGLEGPLRVMQSNGGVMTAAVARSKPIQTLFSGPVGGTVAGVSVSRDLREELPADRLICVDMGGTSFDVSLVVDGRAEVEAQATLEGHPILAPSVAIHTIGAGGGSVGHVAGGGLRVGPRSAGAEPGPACYGAGGTEPAITDANLHLGRIPAVARLGGGMELDQAAAATALGGVAEQLDLGVDELAAGMVAVADAAMANAIREITVMRGIDPRTFSLVAFGGAGPLHAVAIAEELDIATVVVPADPGVLSAYGMLQSDTRHDAVQNYFVRVAEAAPEALQAAIADLEERARLLLKEDGVEADAIVLEPSADLRYTGQEYTVTIPFDTSGGVEAALRALPERFAAAHDARYGHSNIEEAVEFVNLRMAAIGRIQRAPRQPLSTGELPAPLATERTYFSGTQHDTPVHDRDILPAATVLTGPAIVLEAECTTLVPPGWQLRVSAPGHLILTRTAA
jgi:N-methylhydantoinase A